VKGRERKSKRYHIDVSARFIVPKKRPYGVFIVNTKLPDDFQIVDAFGPKPLVKGTLIFQSTVAVPGTIVGPS